MVFSFRVLLFLKSVVEMSIPISPTKAKSQRKLALEFAQIIAQAMANESPFERFRFPIVAPELIAARTFPALGPMLDAPVIVQSTETDVHGEVVLGV